MATYSASVQIGRAGHLGLVLFRIARHSRLGVNVVKDRIRVFNQQLLVGLNRQNLRGIQAAFLIYHYGWRRRAVGFSGDARRADSDAPGGPLERRTAGDDSPRYERIAVESRTLPEFPPPAANSARDLRELAVESKRIQGLEIAFGE